MLLTNTNINTLPFYKTKEEQWHRREGCEYHPIFMPTNRLLPFQLISSLTTGIVMTIEMYDYTDSFVKTIPSSSNIIYDPTLGEFSSIIYKGNEFFENLIPAGQLFYVKIILEKAGVFDYFYSDLFESGNGLSDVIKLTYWNEKNIDYGDYFIFAKYNASSYFPFISYFNSEIGRPGYEFESDISERNGLEYPLVLRSNKTFTFPITVNEPQMDALRLAAISDQIAIEQGDNLYKVFWLEFSEIEWGQNGIGTVYITFKVNAMINKTSPAASTRGDFNNDFNEDFL